MVYEHFCLFSKPCAHSMEEGCLVPLAPLKARIHLVLCSWLTLLMLLATSVLGSTELATFQSQQNSCQKASALPVC